MPINYDLYPKNWHTEIRPRILERANNCCELCGVENSRWVWQHPSIHYLFSQEAQVASRWYGASEATEPQHGYLVVLTISHTNHDITDNRDENLQALCQTCHLRHDADYHAMNRVREKNRQLEEAGQMRLF